MTLNKEMYVCKDKQSNRQQLRRGICIRHYWFHDKGVLVKQSLAGCDLSQNHLMEQDNNLLL